MRRAGAVLTTHEVQRAVDCVLRAERVAPEALSIAFLSSQQMRALNRRALGRDRATDVIAFPLHHGGKIVGDIYVCPSVARRSANDEGVSRREEEIRLVIHGVLHAIGHDHPRGQRRVDSEMWRRQEHYVRQVLGDGSP